MKDVTISENVIYIGADDKDIDLFESQYVVPNGISYNSYLIKDEKIVIMDTIDKRKTDEWLENLEKALKGKKPDYLVVSHLEPDHAYNIGLIAAKYPSMRIIGNEKTFAMLPQFFEIEKLEERKIVVKEGDEINIGEHTLQFFMAPMVHWPEVMFTYDEKEKVLFAADGFGKFGFPDLDKKEWIEEARRYYFNICGKYGAQVQAVLKKALNLDINIICSLHGPVLKENLEYYINKYDIWSKYEPEEKGILIAYNSIHGNTKNAVKLLEEILKIKTEEPIVLCDLAREDMSRVVEYAFMYDKLIIASPTYDAGLFPTTETFLRKLKHKNYQNRKVGIIENGSWAPMAGKLMKNILEEMKNIKICEPIITIKTTANDSTTKAFENLVNEILK